MRTIVVSDLHLGLGRRRAVLESPAPRERLLAALDGVDRLVLLGDAVELTGRPRARSLATAEPILRALGQRLGRDREVVVVPGNHDRPLIGRWLERHARELDIDTVVRADASPELGRLVSWLAPARVTVRYPGLWLGDGVWASHGHYLNRHLAPQSVYGWLRSRAGREQRGPVTPRAYERARHERHAPRSRGPLDRFGRLLMHGALSPHRAVSAVLDPRLAPVIWPVLSLQMQHAAVPAMARVAARLGVDADTVLFGHVHRLGPRDGDGPEEWRASDGRPGLLNTGSWVYEPMLLHGAGPPHPYWPGGAVVLAPGKAPRAVGLLDDLDAASLRRGGPRIR